MIITELSVVVIVLATKYHRCLPGGIQLCWATVAIMGVLILVVLACFIFHGRRFSVFTNLFYELSTIKESLMVLVLVMHHIL